MRRPEDDDCWQVSGLRDAEAFFLTVGELVPEATHLCLEGSPAPDVAALLERHLEARGYAAPAGTMWSWPRANRRYVVKVSATLLTELAAAAAHHAEPELCSHLHVYRDAEPLAQWFDAFDDPLLVAKAIPRERVEAFARAAGGTLNNA